MKKYKSIIKNKLDKYICGICGRKLRYDFEISIGVCETCQFKIIKNPS